MPIDAWTPWGYATADSRPYLVNGDDETYRLGAQWLEGLHVSDWGCGLGWMRKYVPADLYTGIDGTPSRYADIVADLADFIHPTQGLFMRHVLEHDERWPAILDNALKSFGTRMFLVLYTPLVEETHVHLWEPTLHVPEIHFALEDIMRPLHGLKVEIAVVGTETCFRIER